jgi:hypothetical protein
MTGTTYSAIEKVRAAATRLRPDDRIDHTRPGCFPDYRHDAPRTARARPSRRAVPAEKPIVFISIDGESVTDCCILETPRLIRIQKTADKTDP